MEVTTDGKTMTIKVDLGKGILSSTGKSLVVATSNGFQGVQGTDLRISLNIIKPAR